VTSLLERRGAASATADLQAHPGVAGASAAVQAAAVSIGVLLVPVVLGWVAGSRGLTTTGQAWPQVLRATAGLWLSAQRVGLTIAGVTVTLTPLLLTVLPLATCLWAARRMARRLDPYAERIEAGASRRAAAPAPPSALVALALAHGGIGAALALLITSSDLQVALWQAALGPAVVGGLGALGGTAAYEAGGWRAGAAALVHRLPEPLAGWVKPALAAITVVLAGATVVVLVSLALGASRVASLQHLLGGNGVDTALMDLGQLTVLPNLATWVAGALVGPGFTVGAGTSVTLVGSSLATLPAVPVLAALPAAGPAPAAAMLLLTLPVLGGAAAGWLLLRLEMDSPLSWLLTDLAGTALLAGLGLGGLGWLGSGAVGPGRLAEVGSATGAGAVFVLAAVFVVEVVLGALAVVGVVRWGPPLAAALTGGRAGYRRRP
jgi:Family of unknown function (DUF6350)